MEQYPLLHASTAVLLLTVDLPTPVACTDLGDFRLMAIHFLSGLNVISAPYLLRPVVHSTFFFDEKKRLTTPADHLVQEIALTYII